MLSADGNLTSYENLLMFSKLCDVPRDKRVRLALSTMGLSEAGNKLVKTYSGGMVHRL